MRRTAFFLGLVAALTFAPAAHAQTSTDVATIDLNQLYGRPVEELVAATLGQPGAPRYSFEMLHNGVHVAVVDMVQLGQVRCPSPERGRSGGPVLVRDGIVIASLSNGPVTFLAEGRPEVQSSFTTDRNGRIVLRNNDATPRDPPAPLPLAAGLEPAIAGTSNFNARSTGFHRITCVDYSGARGSTEGAIQSALIAPSILFRPAENQSRENARVRGTALYDAITLGAALPAHLASQASEARVRVRTHPGDAGYQVVTLDLGGGRTSGVAQPRSVGYVGVRNGIVEWKALSFDGGMFSDLLCVSADGRRGRVRPGCTSTGFYFP